MPLGKMETGDTCTVWHNEAGDFTLWHAQEENQAALSEVLHLGESALKSTELSVGDFSADRSSPAASHTFPKRRER